MKEIYRWGRRFLAKIWLKVHPSVFIIGVTGSYGKTNTTTAIATVLAQKFKTLQTDLNLDTIYNLPTTLLKLRGQQKLVLEYGIDHRGEMDDHLFLVKPQMGVITGINPTHSDPELLGSLENIIKEKGKLIAVLGKDDYALLNYDDGKVRGMAKLTKARVVWYGQNLKCDYRAEKIKVGLKGTSFDLVNGEKKIRLKTGLVGRHFVYACLAAAAAGRLSGLSWQRIKKGLSRLKPLKGRLSVEKGPRGAILLNDSLRANPASTMAGLQVLTELKAKKRKIAVLGEMGELGEMKEAGHREVGRFAAKSKPDYLIGVGPLTKYILEEAKGVKSFWAKDVAAAAAALGRILAKEDMLYVKGSLLKHLERILLILKKQKVGCRVVSCHFYRHCATCSYLKSGLK
ncbi:MAG: UDP-N-acetylmuramoyl-tripeptide--D-alanyl-D-alanine ligase [Candidatus Shapirobacteria bacterium]